MARASSDPDWRDSGNHRKANSGDDDFPVNQGNTNALTGMTTSGNVIPERQALSLNPSRKREGTVNWTGRWFLLCLVTILSGCATGISQYAGSQVTYHGSFSVLQADISRHRGEVVMLGGKVVETHSTQFVSEITVLQLPLDGRGRPIDGDRTEGRYLVRSAQFLDPALYEKGTLITVVGTLTGGESRLIGGFSYVHPVVEILEVKTWHGRQDTEPSFHLGIGVGTWF